MKQSSIAYGDQVIGGTNSSTLGQVEPDDIAEVEQGLLTLCLIKPFRYG